MMPLNIKMLSSWNMTLNKFAHFFVKSKYIYFSPRNLFCWNTVLIIGKKLIQPKTIIVSQLYPLKLVSLKHLILLLLLDSVCVCVSVCMCGWARVYLYAFSQETPKLFFFFLHWTLDSVKKCFSSGVKQGDMLSRWNFPCGIL